MIEKILSRIPTINQIKHRWITRFSQNKQSFSHKELELEGYFSQYGQDKYVSQVLFPGVTSGVFVDIGAHDGIKLSNTFYLEKELGWTGIAIEPIPDIFELLARNRKCITINGCVAANPGKARFQRIVGYAEMLSGLVDNYNSAHLRRIQKSVQDYGGEIEEIEVDCYVLGDLLEKHNITNIDYLSIDVEGAEFSILQAIDFKKYNFSSIGIENNYKDYRIPQFLYTKGFKFDSFVGCDEFYVKI